MFTEKCRETAAGPAIDEHIYPPYSFDLYLLPLSTNTQLNRREIVARSLSALSICTSISSETSSNNATLTPEYTYSANKLRWNERYMSAQLSPGVNCRAPLPLRRKDVIDSPAIVVDVLHDLAINNHPVFQLVSWLEKNYGEQIGDTTIEDVASDIIVMTQLPRYRSAVDKQLETFNKMLPFYPYPRQPGSSKGRTQTANRSKSAPGEEDTKSSSFSKPKSSKSKLNKPKKDTRAKPFNPLKSRSFNRATTFTPVKSGPPYRIAPKRKIAL